MILVRVTAHTVYTPHGHPLAVADVQQIKLIDDQLVFGTYMDHGCVGSGWVLDKLGFRKKLLKIGI